MGKSSKEAQSGGSGIRSSVIALLIVLAFVVGGIFVFLKFYSAFIDRTLYAERLNQMREVTTQLFSGLEDVMNNQWRTTSERCLTFRQEQPQNMEDVITFMQEQTYLADLESIQCDVVAVTDTGAYCTENGWQGLLAE